MLLIRFLGKVPGAFPGMKIQKAEDQEGIWGEVGMEKSQDLQRDPGLRLTHAAIRFCSETRP